MSKARMTYRPDGRGKLVQHSGKTGSLRSGDGGAAEPAGIEPKSVPDGGLELRPAAGMTSPIQSPVQSLSSMDFTTHYGGWSSPFEDSDFLETLIASETGSGPKSFREDLQPYLESDRSIKLEQRPAAAAPAATAPSRAIQTSAFPVEVDEPGLESLTESPEWSQWPEPLPVKGVLSDEFHHPLLDLEEIRAARKLNSAPARPKGSGNAARGSRKGPSWTAVLLSVAGAIATGAVFGYIALALFAGGGVIPAASGVDGSKSAVSDLNEPGTAGKGAASAAEATKSGSDSEKTAAGSAEKQGAGLPAAEEQVQADWPETDFSLLQYGVFSAKDSAEAAAAELKAGGIAHAVAPSGGGYRVYAGLTSKPGEAQTLADAIAGTTIYIKSSTLPAVGKISFAGSTADAKSFGPATTALLLSFSKLTLTELALNKPQAGGAEAEALNLRLEEWQLAYSRFRAGLQGKEQSAAADQLKSAVDEAAAAWKTYGSKPSKAALWPMQSGLMEVFFSQRELIAALQS